MPDPGASPSRLLSENIDLFQCLECETSVLDLACGTGRNGFYLLAHNIPVTFADKNRASLEQIARQCAGNPTAKIWPVDLETDDIDPLAGKQFDGIIVFNYLHRPLFSSIREAVRPGGLVMYQTFTRAQRKYGRPTNPAYLLREGELAAEFAGWEILQQFEGELDNPRRAVAALIARRP